MVAFTFYSYTSLSSQSSPSDSSMKSQTEINVVFEEAHSPLAPIIWPCGCPGTYSGFANYLIENGYTVSTINPGTMITSSILSSVDILVIVAPQQEYEPSELEAIETWIKNGGSLLLISEEHCLGNIAATIAGVSYHLCRLLFHRLRILQLAILLMLSHVRLCFLH